MYEISMPSSRLRNTTLVSSSVSLTSWGEGSSLALVGYCSSDGVTIEIPNEVDILLHSPTLHLIFFPIGLVKTEFESLD